ncbi:hypothetical protein [Antrihabitans cavernicola]|uniref:Uncharacterized protein n=1 Tax=Antrihabitans cavernicola TaxID=2495913 RepID=A0A5A7SGW4_9NOCA|nr:hypothetical protein [Spelaeibacter cavernicola]KAA0023735.1 hypothetical protein FOY51_03760 [Spelaeibacter cavernicola]
MTDPIEHPRGSRPGRASTHGVTRPDARAVIDALAALPDHHRRTLVRTFYGPNNPETDAAALQRLHVGMRSLRALLDS